MSKKLERAARRVRTELASLKDAYRLLRLKEAARDALISEVETARELRTLAAGNLRDAENALIEAAAGESIRHMDYSFFSKRDHDAE